MQTKRAPVCCILGHVDVGKTFLIDRIAKTKLETGDSIGITQQLGVTFIPNSVLCEYTACELPGILFIDTPGMESLSHDRYRGISICDMAILVIDLLMGLEQLTFDALEQIKKHNKPFMIIANKIDRIYGWNSKKSIAEQTRDVIQFLEARIIFIERELAANNINASVDERKDHVKIVPTSGITGEGIPNIITDIVQLSQQSEAKITDEIECHILDVRCVEKHRYAATVILKSGILREGDQFVVAGNKQAIVTNVTHLLVQQRTSRFEMLGEVHGPQCVRVVAQGLENDVPGGKMLVVRQGDDVDELCSSVMSIYDDLNEKLSQNGVSVFTSSFHQLELILQILENERIPVSHLSVSDIQESDVLRASAQSFEDRVIVCFDTNISRYVLEFAESNDVTVISSSIRYHIVDMLKNHRRKRDTPLEIWPCCIKILPDSVFRKKNPIIVGVEVLKGKVCVGTPLVVLNCDIEGEGNVIGYQYIGKVTKIQNSTQSVYEAEKGESVVVMIESELTYGRNFDQGLLYSQISRESLNHLKQNRREELQSRLRELFPLIRKLKQCLEIDVIKDEP
jgi:small GTP-binding protein